MTPDNTEIAVSVFVSYRRDDCGDAAGRLAAILQERFGQETVFFDTESIEYGAPFPARIEAALAGAQVVLVVIGGTWVQASDKWGRRRLDDPDDWVRHEIETALSNVHTVVIPVLMHLVEMPPPDALPPDLADLAWANRVRLSRDQFRNDALLLSKRIEDLGVRPQGHLIRGEPAGQEAEEVVRELSICARLKTPDTGYKLFQLIQRAKALRVPSPAAPGGHFRNVDLDPPTGKSDGADFSTCDLHNADFSGAKLAWANFEDATLRRATFDQSQAPMTTFNHAIARSASFKGSHLLAADFGGADMTSARFDEAVLAGVRFINSDLSDVTFTRANLNAADFTGALNLSHDGLIRAKTLYLARGIPATIERRINADAPHLTRKPEDARDVLIASKDDPGAQKDNLASLVKLVATMSQDDFEVFMASLNAAERANFAELRARLRGGPGQQEG